MPVAEARALLLATLLLAASTVQAEPLTLRLSDAEKQALIAGNAERNMTDLAAQPYLPDLPILNDRRPHGEVGVMIGTGGARAIFGATSVPLGDQGWATFRFEKSRNIWPYRY